MVALISHTTIDSHDPYTLSRWWQQVLDYVEDPADPNLPEHDECVISSRDGGHHLLFQRVPDPKVVKNRLHLDLQPVTGTRDAELARLLELGAEQVDDLRKPDGTGWVLLHDPEGNEFCICRGAEERAAG